MPNSDIWPLHQNDVKTAFGLLTRLPVKIDADLAQKRGAAQLWAFPFVGFALGPLVCAVAVLGGALSLPPLAIGFAVVALLAIITGAMHEDGFADCLDGFWGGWTPAQRLDIMKDSRVGVYAVVGLVCLIGIKAVLWAEILQDHIWAAMGILALSRAMMLPVMYYLPHARPTGLSGSVGTPPRDIMFVGLGLGVFLAVVCGIWPAVIFCGLATWGMAALAQRKIGGQTGDVLGATQQIAELGALIAVVAV